MRNIIKVLLNEGVEREDVVAICKYIKENYEVNEAKLSYDEFCKKMDEIKDNKEASGKSRKLTPSEKIANKTKREEIMTPVEKKKPKTTTMLGNPEKEETKEPKYLLGTPIKYPPLK